MLDWDHIERDLDSYGCATTPGLLRPQECDTLSALYADDRLYRSRVVMRQHGFGSGEYKYFRYPLPAIVERLRTELYGPVTTSSPGFRPEMTSKY